MHGFEIRFKGCWKITKFTIGFIRKEKAEKPHRLNTTYKTCNRCRSQI